ncbi:uncharacterized protein [Epargyreus clarus]|uniref:uncharacterized protein n=1 Tax=Epargyreus clarus TaxID=520877 RepID=UPI003C2FA394
METDKPTYCRLCAELKSPDKVLNLVKDEKICKEIVFKLGFLNAMYVEVNSDKILPKTICFLCYDSLNKAYEFLDKVKRSQDVLLHLFSNEDSKFDLSDDDRAYDFLNNDISESLPVKLEVPADTGHSDINLKQEPKEEIDSTVIDESSVSGDYDQTLNVQDILDAAMCKMPFTEDVEIYAKEVSGIDKKTVLAWKDYPWICSFCNIEFLDAVTLRSHAKITHGKCNAFTCIDCKNYGKSDFNSFIKHVRRHRRKLRKRCYYCDAVIEEETSSTHLQEHFQKNEVPCTLCGEVLRNDDALQQHLGEYNSIKPKRKPRRKRGTPITEADLTCELCKKVYKNPNSLRDHMKIHTNDRKRNFTCDRCGKMFFNKGTLTSHIMSHDQVRPHTCRICYKSFLFPNMLRRHVEMHSGVKPYSCEQCGRCFRLQYQLNAHKIIHTDSMPHVCQYCNKAFRFKQILKNHERQHTGAKPYSCQNCGMEFTNWSNYNKHMKRRHGTDTSKKKITPDGVFPVNPQTGQIFQHQDPGTEEWKTKIMVPAKRGKKRGIKQEGS